MAATATLTRPGPARTSAPAAAAAVITRELEATSPAAERNAAVDAFVSRLLAVTEEFASGGAYAAARRRILRDLEELGPQPLATMQRPWPVTNHYLRYLVNQLEEDGLVQCTREAGQEVVRITATGVQAIHATRQVQADLIARLLTRVAQNDTAGATDVFRVIRAALDSRERDGG